MSQPLVLSLFPGIGLLDMAFEEEGFCVVRGPDVLWGGDIRRFHPPAGVFDGVIGGPPCKPFSRLVHMVRHNGYEVAENLIPEFSRCVFEALPWWFLMENVEAAPPPEVHGYRCTSSLLNNRWTSEAPAQNRLRRVYFGGPLPGLPELEFDVCVFENGAWEPAIVASGGGRPVTVAIGGSGKPKSTSTRLGEIGYATKDYFRRSCELQGLPSGFLDDAPFTVSGKVEVVGNGVPLPMGRAIARAVKRAMGYEAAA